MTNKIYVANQGSNNVTVIDGATDTTSTVAAGTTPYAIAVNPITNKIYVTNESSGDVTVIDGATNKTSTVAAGITPGAIAIDPLTNKIYVANYNSANATVIDGATNAISTVAAGTNPYAIAVNPVTNKIYVANQGSANVTEIDGATNAISTVAAGTTPHAIAVNPVTNKIYVANQGSNNVTVIDGATDTTSTVAAGITPGAIAVNPVTNKIYVAQGSNNVTVIDGATNAISTVAAGTTPYAIAVNTITNKIYVANFNGSNVTVIDGATDTTSTVAAVTDPYAIAVNPVTNKIYVANVNSNTVTVIDGATDTTSTVAAGTNPYAIAVNPITNKIYVTNESSSDVTVIDGATNTTSTVAAETTPYAIAVNPITNKIYVANYNSGNVTVIDGATNATSTVAAGFNPYAIAINPVTNKIYVANYSIATVTVIDGATDTTSTVTAGTNPYAIAVSPVTNKIYVANQSSNNVTVITEQQLQTIPLSASITPLQGNQTLSTTLSFTFTAQSSFSPIAPNPQNVFFQLDTWQGPWTRATNNGSSFSGTVASLLAGFHILYAYADDGQDATSTQVDSPLVSAITAYGFLVAPPTFTLAASPSTATVATGHTAVFNAIATGMPAPTYQWTLNGSTTIPGTSVTNDPILVITGAVSSDAGTLVCTASNGIGTPATSSATLTVTTTSDPGYLTNLSGRGVVGSGPANALFGGFGTSGSGTKNLLIRGMGPSLTLVNIPAGTELASTQLTLFDHLSVEITQNTDWAGNATIAAIENQVGAYPVPASSLDSMLYVQEPVNAYSASVGGVGGATGIAVVELYDADTPPLASRLVNLSVRAPVGTGNNILFGGFSIGGTTDEAILIRAIGPSLATVFPQSFTPSSVLAQPILTIFQGSTPIYSNTVWGGDPALVAAEGVVGAYPISTSSQDSLLLISVPPGNYTAEITGVNYTTGIVTVEVYEVQ